MCMKRRSMILISLILVLVGSSIPVQAAGRSTEIQQVNQQLKKQHFTGSVLIIRDGRTILQHSYGYANFMKLQPNTTASDYQLASTQKVLTAVLFMQLVQAGKVQLNAPLSRYYPQIAHSKQITLRQMLDMNSGLYSMTDAQTMLSDSQLIKFAAQHVKVKAIGQHNYEPVNYTLLTGIIERVTQQSYQTLVKQRIIRPLKLQHTGFMLADYQQEATTTVAYKAVNSFLPYLVHDHESKIALNRKLGTGNMYSTVTDLFRLEQAIQQNKLLKPASVATLFNATDGSYRGGLYNYRDFVVSHGVESSYEAGLAMSRDGYSGVILLSNRKTGVSLSQQARKLYQRLRL